MLAGALMKPADKTMKTLLLPLAVLLLLLCGCGGSQTPDAGAEQPPVNTDFPVGAALPNNSYSASYQILIFGNSHVRSNNLADLIQQLIVAGKPGVQVNIVLAPGGAFLDERLTDGDGLLLLQSKAWTQVILQGQKYSTSGLNTYPVDGTLLWIRASKAQGATPILFPEHRQVSVFDEGIRVHQLHQSIAAIEPSCVAPVGMAWDRALAEHPGLPLHTADGNHAALAGSFLTALIFYHSITGNNPDSLPFLQNIEIPALQQQLLRQVAAATLQQHQACPF
jgi:hypothetical protein